MPINKEDIKQKLEKYKEKWINFLGDNTELILKGSGLGEDASVGTIPYWLRDADHLQEDITIPSNYSGDINSVFNKNDRSNSNKVYQESTVIYETNIINNYYDSNSLPSKPGSLLPVRDEPDGDGQTPTKISLGAPITLAQSLQSQRFGQLLFNPFSNKKESIRQAGNFNIKKNLEDLNDDGIEKFASYLAKEKESNALDAIAIFFPTSVRGLSGKISLLFGKDTIRYYFANLTASSINARIGVSTVIPSGYEIVQYEPSLDASLNDVEGVKLEQQDSGLTEKIYKILGGDAWQETEDEGLGMIVKPEQLIKTVGNILYNENTSTLTPLTVTNLLELLTAYSTVDFYRSGHHRLPATVFTSLRNTSDGNVPEQIYDAMSYLDWMTRQIDGLVGEFPLKLKFKTLNDEDKEVEKEIVLENIAEAIAELLPVLLNIAEDSDTAINIGMKTLVEAMKATNTALTTYDYAVANAEYLGYKGNEKKREIDLTFSPGAKNMREALKPSKREIVGWKNEDKDTLIEVVKRVLISTEIIKAASFIPFTPGDKVTGDAIKDSQDQQEIDDDAAWELFKQRVTNPTGRYKVSKPTAKIKDLTVDNPASEA